ncbi:cytochrome P450 [Clavulina sp. PMI_390]|nr:cytochrome P450 [Clavulina sp. PMI_390]
MAGILLMLATILRSKTVLRTVRLPPGPRGLPWIGQALQMPMFHIQLYYTRLYKIYGDIYTLTALGHKIIVLNTYEIAFEVFGRHGAINCNRPPNPFMTRFLGLDKVIVLMNTNKDWKEGRRLYQTVYGKESSRTHYSKDITFHARNYILDGLERAQDQDCGLLDIAVHKMALQSTYGLSLKDDDPILLNALEATEVASASIVPGKHIVNLLPSLQHLPDWVPFQNWRTEARMSRKVLDPLSEMPWRRFLANNAEGATNESFAQRILSEQTSDNAHLLQTLAATNLMAGAEATVGVCRIFILALLLHPEVQRKAQEEIDRVVGRDRMPTIDDQPDLPYLDAVIKEVLRWQPVAPISNPTTPRRNGMYKDYDIPRNTIVIQNTWAISRDETMYPNGDSFDPERWLTDDPPRDSRLWCFGIGRRICPGMAYAEMVYTIIFMTLLATVDIVPAKDADGKEKYVDPSVLTTGHLVSIPLPFSYAIRPRSKATVSLIRESMLFEG